MMRIKITGLAFFMLVVQGFGQLVKDDKIPFAPIQNRRPENFKPGITFMSIENLKANFSDDMMRRAAKAYEIVNEVNSQGKWKPTPESIDSHKAPEWFKDAKFGMFIDWGLWSVGGWAPKREKGAMYPDWYEFRMEEDSTFKMYHEKNWGKDFKRDDLHSYDITSYFYNRAEGRKEVAVNDRYGKENGKWLRSRRGDIFTNEYGDMEKEAKQTFHAWEENRGISQSFGYNWQDTETNVISSKKFIDMFIDIVANGGNLCLIVNLDGKGALPKVEEDRLREIGKWLKVNDEGIYSTRPYSRQAEGSVAYTCSKDNQYVYAILKEWPGAEMKLKGIRAEKDSRIEMLGYNSPLVWSKSEDEITVKLPAKLQDAKNRPCDNAWVLKIRTVKM